MAHREIPLHLIGIIDSSSGLVIVNPFTFSDVTDIFPDLREVSSFIVCQVFRESLVCLLKIFW